MVPSVAVTSACVSPRVNSAEPWVRGKHAGLDRDGSDLVEGAAIGTNPILGHLLAEDPFAQQFVVVRQLLLRRGIVGRKLAASSSLICLTSA